MAPLPCRTDRTTARRRGSGKRAHKIGPSVGLLVTLHFGRSLEVKTETAPELSTRLPRKEPRKLAGLGWEEYTLPGYLIRDGCPSAN
jgi:hypothetical protein